MREKLFNWLNFVKIWSTPGEFNVLVPPLSPGGLVTTQALQYLDKIILDVVQTLKAVEKYALWTMFEMNHYSYRNGSFV